MTYADIQVDDITADQITATGNLTVATNRLTVNASTGALGVGATTFGGVPALADVEITANTAPTAATWS